MGPVQEQKLTHTIHIYKNNVTEYSTTACERKPPYEIANNVVCDPMKIEQVTWTTNEEQTMCLWVAKIAK